MLASPEDKVTAVVVPLALVAGSVGGMVWGLFAGVLKVYGKVNEIFGGLGLYFVALGMTTYLVIGPWARAGVASTSGTDLFDEDVWFPRIGSLEISWLSLLLAVLSPLPFGTCSAADSPRVSFDMDPVIACRFHEGVAKG